MTNEAKSGPRVVDNDRDEITVTLDGKDIRGWSYRDETERRVKITAAREFVEGWWQGVEHSAAPELAATVRELLAIHEAHHNHPTHAAARRLLAKAEGRAA